MKYFIVLLFFVAGWVPLEGQQVLISEKISLRNEYAFFLLGKHNDQYLLFRDRQTEFIVDAFNDEMAHVWSKEVELEGRHPQIIEAFGGPSGFYVIYQYKKKGRTILAAHLFDPTLNLKDSLVIMDYGHRFNTPYPMVQFSDDRSKVLLYHVEGDRKVEAIAFDAHRMKSLWNAEFDLDINLKGKYNFQAIMGNDGHGFIAYELNNRKTKLSKHHFVIQGHNGIHQTKYQVPLPEFLVMDYYFLYDNLHHKLLGTGIFSEKNLVEGTGLYVIRLGSATNHSIGKAYFDDQLVASMAGKTKKNKTQGMEDILIRDAVVRSDGGAVVFIEKEKVFNRTPIGPTSPFMNRGHARLSIDYYYEDVLAVSLNPDGKLDWNTILYKQQFSQNDEGYFSSYFLLKNKSSLKLLFNDDIKSKTNISGYTLQANGTYARSSIFNSGGYELLLRMKDGLQLTPSEVIIPSQYKRRLKLVLIKY